MGTRDGALARATRFFDGDGFRGRLRELDLGTVILTG
jgi:hypothetical protein